MASAEIAEGMVKVYAAKRGLPEALGSGWVVILRPHLKWIFLLRDAPNFMKRGGMAAVVKHQPRLEPILELLEPLVQKALTSSSASKRCAVDLGASVNSVKGTVGYTLTSCCLVVERESDAKNLHCEELVHQSPDAAAPRKYTEHDRYT